jgi:hypothetical protein
MAAVHDRNREIGRGPTEHISEDDDAIPIIGAGNRPNNVLPPLIHVVFRTDRDSLNEFLRTNDMLDCMPKLFSQLAMSDKHKSDHDITAPIA